MSEKTGSPKIQELLPLIIVALSLILIIIIGGFLYQKYITNTSEITSFEECVAAGHSVMESYPRQCAVPNGESFVENIEDLNNDNYENSNESSDSAESTENNEDDSQYNQKCILDSDCVLVNTERIFPCCYEDACDGKDYAEENWIAVNNAWNELNISSLCQDPETCGPAPSCEPQISNVNLQAKCVDKVCVKK